MTRPTVFLSLTMAATTVLVASMSGLAQVPGVQHRTDDLEFYEDNYLQDEEFERKFLGTDDDLDEFGDDLEVGRFNARDDFPPRRYDRGAAGDFDVRIDPDTDFEAYGRDDFVRQFEVPSRYIDRSDQPRGLMPEGYGYPQSPYLPLGMRQADEEMWVDTYYGYERFDELGPREAVRDQRIVEPVRPPRWRVWAGDEADDRRAPPPPGRVRVRRYGEEVEVDIGADVVPDGDTFETADDILDGPEPVRSREADQFWYED